ncbi:hypothetical protein EHZ47_08995 [Aeromonas jandaei]|uniref:hypothetical protein n=1 Tax=Aeromonas jandaei TaxID=650 RepID=UPI000F52AF2C|nr:hypothetical protein [Aeromonas jandaei]RQM76184.1 hypothetical protein EHZ47_08995 [Aeromonas jandaei]
MTSRYGMWFVGALALLLSQVVIAAPGEQVISPETLFGEIGQQPTKSYTVDDGNGWYFATPGRDIWDEEKMDPESGPRFSVEYRGKPLSRINLTLLQFKDDPEQKENNAKVGQMFAKAIEAITGSGEVIGQLESGKISGRMAGFVNGYRITSSPSIGGGMFVTIYRE